MCSRWKTNYPIWKLSPDLNWKHKYTFVINDNLIVNNESWQENKVKDGDKLEIVSIVGGG